MHHQGEHPGQNINNGRHGGDHGHRQPYGIGCSIRPGNAVPVTVLVAALYDGVLLLHGWRDGPSAYLCPSDAAALRRELAAAFDATSLSESSSRRDTR
jgi:hypothetical protein